VYILKEPHMLKEPHVHVLIGIKKALKKALKVAL